LRGELPKLFAEGISTAETAKAITQHYEAAVAARPIAR